MDPQDFEKPFSHIEPMENLIEALLDKSRLDQVVKVRATLPEKYMQLINFLNKNIEVFSWLPNDMSAIDSVVT